MLKCGFINAGLLKRNMFLSKRKAVTSNQNQVFLFCFVSLKNFIDTNF